MSGLIDQAGLTAGAGLSNGAGLYKYANFNPFDPTDLDPYLLFDTAAGSMIGTLENPTLDLDPTNQETLDVITATRAGTATITDQDGNIATAPANTVRVDQTQGAELTPTKFQHIENTDFSNWSHARTSGTANAAISPDGQNNATYVVQNAGQTNAGSIYRFDAAFTGVFTLSVYAKKKEKDFVVLYDSNVGRTYFNLDTGTIGTVASGNTANIEDAGNGWFRCSTTFTASSGTVKAFYVGDNDNNSVVTDGGGIYVWGPQLEEGTTASSFVANTTGSPKFITGATFGPRVPMILVEPSATNLVTYSEDFSDSSWTKSGSSVVSGQTSPSGDTSAFKLVEDTNSGEHKVSTGIITVSAGNTDTYSVFVKRAGRTKVAIREEQHGGKYVSFNLLSKTVISNTGLTANIIELSEDWLRIDYSQNSGGGLEKFSLFLLDDAYTSGSPTSHSYTGDGTSGVYIWGAQLEAGSVATSYIPTSGGNAAARTRAADDLVISGSSFTDFYNQSEGTFYVESVPNENTSGSFLFDLSFGNASTERLAIYNSGSNQKIFLRTSGTTWSDNIIGNRPAGGVLSRAAISFKTNNIEASIDGANMTPDTSATMSTTINKMTIGNRYENPNYLNGRIKRLIYWPTESGRL